MIVAQSCFICISVSLREPLLAFDKSKVAKVAAVHVLFGLVSCFFNDIRYRDCNCIRNCALNFLIILTDLVCLGERCASIIYKTAVCDFVIF